MIYAIRDVRKHNFPCGDESVRARRTMTCSNFNVSAFVRTWLHWLAEVRQVFTGARAQRYAES